MLIGLLKSHTTPRRPLKWSKRWWTPNLTQLRRIFYSAARAAKKDPSKDPQAKLAKNTYFHAITVAKQRSRSTYLENADVSDMWRAKATIVGRVIPRIPSFPDAPTPEDVRNEMIKGFFLLIPPIPPRLPHLPDPGYTSVDPSEVSAALSKCSNKSAPSLDHIPYRVWKNVHRASGSLIPALLDPLLRWGVHPAMLKKSLGIVLPKPGKKDYNDTSSYRIIALLPTLSKILERIVAFHLLPLAQASGLIHPN